ncbi:hypothetical protein [Exiguobacterium artemiae]
MKKKTIGFMGMFFATGLLLAGCANDKQAMDHDTMQGSEKNRSTLQLMYRRRRWKTKK